MSEPVRKNMSGTAKALVVFSIGAILSLGMCGLSASVGGGPSSQLSAVAAIGLVACVLGCVLCIIVLIISGIWKSFSK